MRVPGGPPAGGKSAWKSLRGNDGCEGRSTVARAASLFFEKDKISSFGVLVAVATDLKIDTIITECTVCNG